MERRFSYEITTHDNYFDNYLNLFFVFIFRILIKGGHDDE